MIKNIKKLLLGLSIAAFGGLAFGAQQRRPIQEPIPPQVMHYLKQHEVDAELQEHLDEFFGKPETSDLLNGLHLDPMRIFEDEFEKQAEQYGFKFFRKNVFSHTNFPHHIFKFGYAKPSEYQAIGRIRMADDIRETAGKNHFNITTPKKQAYFPSSRNYTFPLRIVIVAEKMDLDRTQELTPEQTAQCEQLAEILQLKDLQLGMGTNVIGFGPNKPIVIIDTEPIDIKLEYPSLPEEKE